MGSKTRGQLRLRCGWRQTVATEPGWAGPRWVGPGLGLGLGSRGLPCSLLHMERVSQEIANEMQADVRQTPTHCFVA